MSDLYKSKIAETSDTDPRDDDPLNETAYADIELFVRPAGTYKRGDPEQYWEASFETFSQLRASTIADNVVSMVDIEAGHWKVGLRRDGDEVYFQRFSVIEPHAEERGEQLLRNHIHGVLNHWRH